MNINPITSINNNQSKSYSKPSFKMVMRAKVYKNGVESNDPKVIRKGVNLLRNVVLGLTGGDKELVGIKFGFKSKMPDLNLDIEAKNKFKNLRSYIDDYLPISYLFTGEHAQTLDSLGRARGLTTKACKEAMEIEDITEEEASQMIKEKGKNYIKKAKEFVADKSIRARNENGNEIGVAIFIKDVPKGKKKSKLGFDTARFREIQGSKKQAEAVPEKQASKPSRRKGKTADWPAKVQQQSDMPKGDGYLSFD